MKFYHLFWDEKENRAYVVGSGFNFLAFVLGIFYFIYYKLPYSFSIFLAANIFIFILGIIFQVSQEWAMLINIVFCLYVGFDANDCIYGEYCKKGYRYLKSDFYFSQEHAIKDVFDTVS